MLKMINTENRIHTISVLKAIIIAGILVISAVFVSSFVSNAPTITILSENSDVPFIELIPGDTWDYSSGLALSESFQDNINEMLYLSVTALNITSVLGKTNDIQVSCDPSPCSEDTFAYGGVPYPYFNHNVFSLLSYWNVKGNTWTSEIERQNNLAGTIIVNIDELFYQNTSNAFINDISSVDNIQKTDNLQFDKQRRLSYDPGDIEFSVNMLFKDGTFIHLTLVQNSLFIHVQAATKYYSNDHEIQYRIEEVSAEQFYFGTLEQFFENFTEAINTDVDIILGG